MILIVLCQKYYLALRKGQFLVHFFLKKEVPRNVSLINFSYRLRGQIVDLSLFHKKNLLQVEFIQSTYFEQAI